VTPVVGELAKALAAGYRVAVHKSHFPYPSRNPEEGIVHAVVDHGARAIFCSREWFESLPKAEA
jgi:hypothetical protein